MPAFGRRKYVASGHGEVDHRFGVVAAFLLVGIQQRIVGFTVNHQRQFATTLFLIACDDRSDDLKAISKFKDLTPPRFSDVVSHQDDVSEEWSQVDYLSGPTLQVLRTRQSPDGCEDGSYYYLVDMQEKTVQPLMNALCIADNIKLEYQEVTDPYTKEKYFEYAHDGKLMGRLLIPSNPDNQE